MDNNVNELKQLKDNRIKGVEYDVIRKIIKERFMHEFKEERIDINAIVKFRDTAPILVSKFNFFLTKLKVNHNISYVESLLFLDDEGYSFNKVLKIVDGYVLREIKHDMGNKYKIDGYRPIKGLDNRYE